MVVLLFFSSTYLYHVYTFIKTHDTVQKINILGKQHVRMLKYIKLFLMYFFKGG